MLTYVVILDNVPLETREADISVSESATGGLGVFPNIGSRIEVGDVVTEYPGEPRWVTGEYLDSLRGEKGQYCFHYGPVHIRHKRNMYILWDAYEKRRTCFDGPKAHWINSSHPCLENFWSRPNCVFGLYLKNMDKRGMSHGPNVRLFILCSRGIEGDGETELLLDYHWHITEHFGVICGDYECKLCFESMKVFMDKWERRLGGQNVHM